MDRKSKGVINREVKEEMRRTDEHTVRILMKWYLRIKLNIIKDHSTTLLQVLLDHRKVHFHHPCLSNQDLVRPVDHAAKLSCKSLGLT